MNDDLKSRLAVFARLMEAEWYNGNMDEGAYDRLNADLTGFFAVYAQENPSQARSEGPGLDWRAKIAAAEEWIGWDSTFCYWCDNDQSEGHAPDCVWVAAQENPEAS